MQLLRYLDDWLVIVESRTLLLQHRDLEIVVSWENSDSSCPLMSSIWGC